MEALAVRRRRVADGSLHSQDHLLANPFAPLLPCFALGKSDRTTAV